MHLNIGHILWELLYWPGGIVVGNLIANVIWESPRLGLMEWRLRKHHGNTAKKEDVEQLKDLLDTSTPGGITEILEMVSKRLETLNVSQGSPES